jgi:hypothetical protein
MLEQKAGNVFLFQLNFYTHCCHDGNSLFLYRGSFLLNVIFSPLFLCSL